MKKLTSRAFRRPSPSCFPLVSRSGLTLVEVLISVFLTSVIIGVLFSLVRTEAAFMKKNKESYSQFAKELRVEQKIQKALLNGNHLYTAEDPVTKTVSLHLTLQSHNDPDPRYRGDIESFFAVRPVKQSSSFCFIQKSSSTEDERCEVLFTGVQQATFTFFADFADLGKEESSWEKGRQLPCFIQLTLTLSKGQKIPFMFWTSVAKCTIDYMI